MVDGPTVLIKIFTYILSFNKELLFYLEELRSLLDIFLDLLN